jgi:hypothetical protein
MPTARFSMRSTTSPDASRASTTCCAGRAYYAARGVSIHANNCLPVSQGRSTACCERTRTSLTTISSRTDSTAGSQDRHDFVVATIKSLLANRYAAGPKIPRHLETRIRANSRRISANTTTQEECFLISSDSLAFAMIREKKTFVGPSARATLTAQRRLHHHRNSSSHCIGCIQRRKELALQYASAIRG